MENQDLLMDMFNFDKDQMSEGANVQQKKRGSHHQSQSSQKDLLKLNLGLVDTNLPKKTLNVKKSLVAQNAKKKA